MPLEETFDAASRNNQERLTFLDRVGSQPSQRGITIRIAINRMLNAGVVLKAFASVQNLQILARILRFHDPLKNIVMAGGRMTVRRHAYAGRTGGQN